LDKEIQKERNNLLIKEHESLLFPWRYRKELGAIK